MDISVMKSQRIAKWAYLCPFIYRRCGNSSAQDFAFTAKSVKTCKLSQKNLPFAEGDLKWTDSVTGRPKAELLWKKKQKVPRKIVDAAIGLFYNTKEYANY